MMRVLLVSYAFPPVGGAGVQRIAKLAKYLPRAGIEPWVLTVQNPSVPLHDPSLLADLPETLRVIRAHTLEPGYALKAEAWRAGANASRSLRARLTRRAASGARALLVPDPQVLWLPAAARALYRERNAVQAILVSGPPFSSHLLGLFGRLAPNVGVVLDYRDEWTTLRHSYEMAGGALFDGVLERACLRSAHRITTATGAFREKLLERFPFLHPDHVVTIENGFDPEDLPRVDPPRMEQRMRLTYAGTVFRLTSAQGFLAALRLLHQRSPAPARLLEVRFIGRIVETEQHYFDGSESLGVTRLGYLPHRDALRQLAGSHVALCLLDACPGAERIYPAKIFELLGLGRPVLALCPEGVLARLVREENLGTVVDPRDAPRIAEALQRLLAEYSSGRLPERSTPRDPERFDRRRQAQRFAEVLADAASAALAGPRDHGAIAASPLTSARSAS